MKFISLIIGLSLGINSFAQQEPVVVDEIVAVVGNQIILASEIATQKNQLREQYKITNPDECAILEELLIERLMLHQAAVDSIDVSESQIQSELDRRMRHFVQQFGSEKKMEEYLGKSMVELKEDYHDQLYDQLRIQQVQGKITEDVNVTPAEVTQYFNNIPIDSLPLISSQVEVAQLVVYPAENSEEISKTIERLEKFRKEVAAGKDFGTLAILYSEDPGSASQNGELGMQEKGTFVPEFDAVAFSLNDGQVSKVFKTQFGYHIMQMIERRGEKYNARHILLKPKSKSEDLIAAKNKLDSLIGVMKRDSISFEVAATRFSMDDDTKNNGGVIVNLQTGSPRFDMSEIDPQVSFTIDKMEVGDVSPPVVLTTTSGTQGYRILKLITRTKPHRANLREDYQLVQEAASSGLRNDAMKSWVNKKIAVSYIKLSDTYRTCVTNYNWKK